MIVVNAVELKQAVDSLINSNVQTIGIYQTKEHDVVFLCVEHNQPRILVQGQEVR